MEILFFIAIGAIVVYLGYRALNRESPDGRHPLDAVTEKSSAPYKVEPPIVDNKTGEPVTVQAEQPPSWHTAPAENTKPLTVEAVVTQALDVNNDGKVNFEDVKEAVKKTRGRVKKAADTNGDGKVTVKDVKVAVKKVKATATKKVAVVKAKAKPARSKKA